MERWSNGVVVSCSGSYSERLASELFPLAHPLRRGGAIDKGANFLFAPEQFQYAIYYCSEQGFFCRGRNGRGADPGPPAPGRYGGDQWRPRFDHDVRHHAAEHYRRLSHQVRRWLGKKVGAFFSGTTGDQRSAVSQRQKTRRSDVVWLRAEGGGREVEGQGF